MDTTQNTALTVQQRASVALKADKRRAEFTELAKQSAQIVAITNPASYQELHSARMRLKNARIEVTKEGEEVRDDAVKFQKGVIALQKELIAIIEVEEVRLFAIQTEHDQRAEREHQAKIEAERQRVERIQATITEIRDSAAGFTALSGSVVIESRLNDLKAHIVDASLYAEFAAESDQAKVAAMVALHKLHAEALEYEAGQRKARADAEELARMRAAEEQRQREAAEKEAADTKRRADEQAAAQAEIDRKAREARLRIEADERAAAERIAEQDRVVRIAREAEERKAAEALAAQQKELREREEVLAAERRAVEDAARLQRQQQEAAEREAQRKADELLDLRDMLTTFRHRSNGMAEFVKVHKAIDAYMTEFNKSRREVA